MNEDRILHTGTLDSKYFYYEKSDLLKPYVSRDGRNFTLSCLFACVKTIQEEAEPNKLCSLKVRF